LAWSYWEILPREPAEDLRARKSNPNLGWRSNSGSNTWPRVRISQNGTITSEVKDFLPAQRVDLEVEDIYSEPPVEGGPKTAELSEEPVDSDRLIEVLDINPKLPESKRKEIQDVIIKNHRAFGLDDRLGHLNQPISIPLKTGA
jgi:hypothetical protein